MCDLADLRANPIYAAQFDEKRLQRLISTAAQSRSWLIFYTHDISDDPTPWGCLPRMLKTVVRHAAESGCKMMPVRDAFQALRIQNNRSDAATTGA